MTDGACWYDKEPIAIPLLNGSLAQTGDGGWLMGTVGEHGSIETRAVANGFDELL